MRFRDVMGLAIAAMTMGATLPERGGALSLQSSAFELGGTLPAIYTCDGKDVSPPLLWSDRPLATQSFVLTLEDRDAPNPTASGDHAFVHWIVYNLPAWSRELGEAVRDLPGGAAQGANDFKATSYRGPCPPSGAQHHYVFQLYALDRRIEGVNAPTIGQLDRELEGHILARGELVATYGK